MSELRKAIEEPLEALGRNVIESITLLPTNVELRKLNKNQAVDAVLDAVIAALPEELQKEFISEGGDLTTREGNQRFHRYGGYDAALRNVKSILEEAKKQ